MPYNLNAMFEKDGGQKLWERYELYIDLFKFYFGVTLKINAFYLAVTGAIVTFYFANPTIENIHLALVFPIFMAVAIIVLFCFGISTIGILEADLEVIRAKLEFTTRVTITSLNYLWVLSIIALLVSAITMGVLICKHS